jgi:hypothetical protein
LAGAQAIVRERADMPCFIERNPGVNFVAIQGVPVFLRTMAQFFRSTSAYRWQFADVFHHRQRQNSVHSVTSSAPQRPALMAQPIVKHAVVA